MKKNYLFKTVLFILLLAVMCVVAGHFYQNRPAEPDKGFNLKHETFAYLSNIREKKIREVKAYFEAINEKVRNAPNDEKLLRYFKGLKDVEHSEDLEYSLDIHYVTNYENFYDLLFVDRDGYIFHSLKKESDYHKNILSDFGPNALSTALKKNRAANFVEFEYYSPSDEPAAFFSIAIKSGEEHLGWIIFQCAANKVNTILTDRSDLGRTGEVYLVNKESLMLSDSRFMADSTILKHRIDTQALKGALTSQQGEKIIADYRGVSVFSSFEMFDVFNASWIIIVEIDEEEVITEHYKQYKKHYQNEIVSYLSSRRAEPVTFRGQFNTLAAKRIDINEYARSENGKPLTTLGVATCTAVAINYPDRFAYLAHISPSDSIYDNGEQSLFSQQAMKEDENSNLLDKIIAKIMHHQLYPYEIGGLEFTIIAPHVESIANSVDVILDHGVELSRIKYLFNPRARSANVLLVPEVNDIFVKWNGSAMARQSSQQSDDLGTVLKRIINYNN